MIHLYNFFHLNIAYSAIEEEDRHSVIEKCYWPLLKLAKERKIKCGIELSGFTLETIEKIDPSWVHELKLLIDNKVCELIGCGYTQVIGPLVPSEVTEENLKIGNDCYKNLLGISPNIALLNEQSYSAGLVEIYKNAGYGAIIMEWDNPSFVHKKWNSEMLYFPQYACDSYKNKIPIIWNSSIGFQKLQRYTHGDLELDEILAYIKGQEANHIRTFSVYGNDVEVFDFRPGRYMTEKRIHEDGEWLRIDNFYKKISEQSNMKFILPSQVLQMNANKYAYQDLTLESANQPIPVKKQSKYNIVRWAVTGRDDFGINTRCWKIYKIFTDQLVKDKSSWKELCYLWSSDFRTHITDIRWAAYLERLKKFENSLNIKLQEKFINSEQLFLKDLNINVNRNGRFLEIQGKRLQVRLNCNKGLAIESFTDKELNVNPLFGTIPHGHFDDISYGADFYSGHLVVEIPGRSKITDLSNVEPSWDFIADSISVSALISTSLGTIEKNWLINDKTGKIILSYNLDWKDPIICSCRFGFVTLFTDLFDRNTLQFETHNGGRKSESFLIDKNLSFSHGKSISSLITAGHLLALTKGRFNFGDSTKNIFIKVKKEEAAVVGMLEHQIINSSTLTRFCLSAREIDETSRPLPLNAINLKIEINASELNK
jgi:hypothetical protein